MKAVNSVKRVPFAQYTAQSWWSKRHLPSPVVRFLPESPTAQISLQQWFVLFPHLPRWVVELGARYHLAVVSLYDVNKLLEEYGIDRTHVTIRNWVHKADLQPTSAVSEEHLTVDPYTNEIRHVSLYPTATKRTTRWFLTGAISSITLNFSSMTQTILDQFSLKMALDFELLAWNSACYRTCLLRDRTENTIVREPFQQCRARGHSKLARSRRRLPQFTLNVTRLNFNGSIDTPVLCTDRG